ncbi:hypothetical protein LCGC14_1137940 [marine sediment metagenome]|uniref:NAD-dependent epimerase/dehydratase domain-containing protein n=1 Tax=marine sediment metagenome TaxID=412755 RepID=A0A0F9PHC0_9ZZZZ
MKTIFVIGSDGYIGHALALRLLHEGHRVIGADDFRRRSAVREMGSFSAVDIQSPKDRLGVFGDNFKFHDITMEEGYGVLCYILDKYKPTSVVNLAQQPSAPYSHKSVQHAVKTVVDNSAGTLNLLWAIKESCPNTHLIQIGSMGEYDPTANVRIPEGIFDFGSGSAIYPRRPGSWYHASKVASTYYIDCACRWWGLKATDIMQGIVYGGWTPEIEETKSYTRLDSDEAFGTVVHRFVVQTLLGHPMTIYGKGLHKRGFLSINDSIQCLMLAIENPPKDENYRTWNQLDTSYSINDISDIVIKIAGQYDINVEKKYIKSPRAEAVNDHYYRPVVNKLKELGFKPTRNLEDEIRFLFNILIDNKDRIKELCNVVMPKITWK